MTKIYTAHNLYSPKNDYLVFFP